jgi:hypothetical protein
MAQYEHLAIYKKAMDLTIYFEKTVKEFSRYQKYTLGTDLRNISREVVKLIIRANSEIDRKPTLFTLRNTLEELKVAIRIGKEVNAFKKFDSFKYALEEVIALSRQNEWWIKSLKGDK